MNSARQIQKSLRGCKNDTDDKECVLSENGWHAFLQAEERKKSLKNAHACDIIIQESGCGAAGSAGGLGPSGRRFEPCHSDHFSWKNRLFRRFFCVKSSIEVVVHVSIVVRGTKRRRRA